MGAFLTTALLSVTAMTTPVNGAGNKYHKSIDSPPCLQWEANYGYCGEVSFITANLRYGQYLSQYDARNIASNGTVQSKERSQLLLGINDYFAAGQMLLKAVQWDNSDAPDSEAFLTWIKDGILSNASVIMAVYTNEYVFYGDTDPTGGDPEYDHIVPVIGWSSSSPLSTPAAYHANDTITFSDNGLYTPNGKPGYVYEYPVGSFQRTRRQANAQNSPPYSVASVAKNYGIAISGIIDHDNQTLPVHLATNLNYEKPNMKDGSNTRPAPEQLTLTITVDCLQPGGHYNIYRYNNFSSVPTSSFNAKRGNAVQSWQIQSANSSSYTFSETISSDEIVIYRALPATAP